MGRKAREGSVNLYYLKNQNENKNKSVSKRKNNANKKSKSNKKEIKKIPKTVEKKFNFDDEIVIGVTKVPESTKKKENRNKQKVTKKNSTSKTKKVQAKKTKKIKKDNKIKIFKYVFITCSIFTAIICFMFSAIFNISEIKVTGNNKLSSEQIISFSCLQIGENIFKINKSKIINNIKENPYVEDVQIKRDIPSILEIDIKERQATYMLEYVNSYAYINNQGYMLEISENKIDRPIITGIITKTDNIKPGNRLENEDLEKLEDVLKIMESANSNEIQSLITKIDITDKLNYMLYIDTEGKSVKLGDIRDISTKMLHVKAILEKEEGIEGEIIVDSVPENNKSRFIQKIN